MTTTVRWRFLDGNIQRGVAKNKSALRICVEAKYKAGTKPTQAIVFLKNTKNNSSLLFATQLTTTKISVVFSHTTQPKP
ncbi:hypothetical protein ACFSQE_12610 [Vogesella fluminis]|uniref:hypothetical protein n=1 Tax=Vogesella fluminis TaxID=1069161 RepID=UPI0036424A90